MGYLIRFVHPNNDMTLLKSLKIKSAKSIFTQWVGMTN
jgi:hypothetical protein